MLQESLNLASEMVADATPRWLSLLGTSGIGKTMLAKRINRVFRREMDGTIASASEVEIRRRRGGFVTWRAVAGALRDGEYRWMDDLCGDWFVCLDDIGSEYATAFTNAKLFEFLSRRERKWTVITGNLSLEQISDTLDARIASRMLRHGNIVVDVNAPDYNLREGTHDTEKQ